MQCLEQQEQTSDKEELVSEIKLTKNWKVAPRISRTIPFGYLEHPDDPDLLLPVPFELEALEKAKHHIKHYSYRDVAKWLEEVTGRYISHVGLRKRINDDKERNRALSGLKLAAKRLEEAIRKYEKAESYNGNEGNNS